MPNLDTQWNIFPRFICRATGLDRNPADLVEVRRLDDSRERYLSEGELHRLMEALDERMYRKGTKTLIRPIFG